MKKAWITAVLWVLLMYLAAAFAEQPTALDAFNALLAEDDQALAAFKTSAEWLDDVTAGKYSTAPQDTLTATSLSASLDGLCAITNGDLAAYASLHNMKVAQLRNSYYKALANVLKAEIMVNPASEEKYRNVQTILKLFIEPDTGADTAASKAAIRDKMSPQYSQKLAQQGNLPTGFVEFVIMDDAWNDDSWENDDAWRESAQWQARLEDSFADITIGSRDADVSTRIADMQEILISLGYLKGKADGVFGPRTQSALLEFQLANGMPATGAFGSDDYDRLQSTEAVARWEYDDDFWDSQDFDSYNTGNTLDTSNTHNTRDTTPDTINTPDTPKANTPDTPGDNTPDTPAANKTASKKQDSPDSPDTPKMSSSSNKPSSKKQDSPDTPKMSSSSKKSSSKKQDSPDTPKKSSSTKKSSSKKQDSPDTPKKSSSSKKSSSKKSSSTKKSSSKKSSKRNSPDSPDSD